VKHGQFDRFEFAQAVQSSDGQFRFVVETFHDAGRSTFSAWGSSVFPAA
jgi:hypothetical protein